MTRLTQQSIDRLHRAGWSEDRRVDVDQIVRSLAARGYIVGPAVEEFLRRFAMIKLSYPNFRDVTRPDGCHFDADTAARNVSRDTVDGWAQRVGSPLVPVGEAFNDHMTLVMAEDGRVFGGYDDYLATVGGDGEDAIEALSSGRDLEEVATTE